MHWLALVRCSMAVRGERMNIKAIFMLPILVALGMGFTRTLFGALPYMTSEPGGVFLLLVMALVLVAIVGKLYTVIISRDGD